ncbi:MAG: FtsX-like permease family protein [Nitrososphaerota archaeon]|jgi:putative ABC transport system permease protein|nr:FtsX-like permease family protein [Nitrososphaerota archaeon]
MRNLKKPMRLRGDIAISLLYKNTLLKIKRSFGRYISLLIIIMVGVGFYAGIQMTAPDVIKVADTYYSDQLLMDFKIVSSMGLTEDDVSALKLLDGVEEVISSYSLDVQSKGSSIRVHAIEEKVNIVKLTEGQMPRSNMECVADNRRYKIGDIVEITDDDVEDKIRNTEFTVVGLIESVLYLSEDYGSTTVGNGKLSSFIFINRDNFVLDAYIEIYIIAKTGNVAAYSDEYEFFASKLDEELYRIKPDRENARYYEIYNNASKIIREKEAELNSEKVKAEKEFANAKKELDANSKKLQDGKKELEENEVLIEDTIRAQNAEFDLAKQKIADGWEEINFALAYVGVTSQEELGSKIDELYSEISDMRAYRDSLPIDSSEYAEVNAIIAECSEKLEGLQQLKDSIDVLDEQEKQLDAGIVAFNVEMEKAKNEIENAKKEIDSHEKKLNDGYKEYFNNLAKFNAEIADGVKKIEEAKVELSDIEQPVWHIFDRDVAVGYSELESSIQIVAIIATVFPLFFILISMLMTSNSMARMITEERGELGTLTALGYRDRNIISTYLLYVLSAAGLGAVAGFFIGCRIIPQLIWDNFVYRLPPLVLQYNMRTFLIIFSVTFMLMSAVTIVTCNRELKHKPAALLRPPSPKHGQQILLEKITVIWKRLSFTWKVTMRNMFRYKKRAFMTIVGVAGCAALLLVAFGVHDGMSGIAQKQYGDIMHYDNMIILKNETTTIDNELQTLLNTQQIINPLLIKQSAYKVEINQKTLDTFLIVPQNNKEIFEEYFNLKSTTTKEHLPLNDNDVIITQRIATVYNLKNDDAITIKDTDNNHYNLTITGVAENYISNYIYINAPTYEEHFGKNITFNTIVSNHNTEKTSEQSDNFIDSGFAINVFFSKDTIESAHENLDKLNGVIILILVVASILAIVVLYNLTAINISERTREIATLKVLGFRDNETNAYIYREAIILTTISIGIGIILGITLHHYVLNLIEINAISLYKNIQWTSFIISATITMAISILMQTITYFKLKKIDMIESLKSIE